MYSLYTENSLELPYAFTAAKQSEFVKYKTGAALFSRNGDLLSIGWNKRKTHPKQKRHAIAAKMPNRECLHAEIDAILHYRGIAAPYWITVTRITKNGNLAMARPCPVCMRAIKKAGITIIEYTDNKGILIRELVKGN